MLLEAVRPLAAAPLAGWRRRQTLARPAGWQHCSAWALHPCRSAQPAHQAAGATSEMCAAAARPRAGGGQCCCRSEKTAQQPMQRWDLALLAALPHAGVVWEAAAVKRACTQAAAAAAAAAVWHSPCATPAASARQSSAAHCHAGPIGAPRSAIANGLGRGSSLQGSRAGRGKLGGPSAPLLVLHSAALMLMGGRIGRPI